MIRSFSTCNIDNCKVNRLFEKIIKNTLCISVVGSIYYIHTQRALCIYVGYINELL